MIVRLRTAFGIGLVAAACLAGSAALSQPGRNAPPPSAPPRLEPVAETRLLMDGIAKPNFDGLGRTLKDRPADAEGWGFARGQALLIAETGNLLLMRPPKTRPAQDAWMARAADLRAAGTRLARAAAEKDYVGARAGVAAVTNACNRCHEAFRVPARLAPFAAGDE